MASLQAVLLCTPQSLWPLTDKRASCLLPLCNRPLLWYQLTALAKSGVFFKSIFLVVATEDLAQVQGFLTDEVEAPVLQRCLLHQVDSLDGDYDAGVLKDLALYGANLGAVASSSAILEPSFKVGSEEPLGPKLDGAFAVVASPILLEDCFPQLLDTFLGEDADVTVLLRRRGAVPSGKKTAMEEAPDEVHFLDEHDRYLYTRSLEDAEVASEAADARQIVLPKALLKQRRRLQMKRNYWDVGVYVMAAWIPRFLATEEGEALTSIRRELVPYVVNHQFRGAAPFGGPELVAAGRTPSLAAAMEHSTRQLELPSLLLSQRCSAQVLPPEELADRTSWPNGEDATKSICVLEAESRDSVRCFAVRMDDVDQLCFRMDSIQSFTEMNRALLRWPTGPRIPWETSLPRGTTLRSREHSAIGASTTIPPNIPIKNSIIGSECVIEEGVKLNGVIMMDGVRVQQGAAVQNSILSSGAVVEKGVRLTDCLVGPGAVVEEGTEARDDIFSAESFA